MNLPNLPTDVTGVKSFLGNSFSWDEQCDYAFQALKSALTSAPILRLPKWGQPFILCTDWSKTAIGAVLSQIDTETGLEHPVAFASRSCTSAESRYSPTEGELLALVWACTLKFRHYLFGYHFTVHTDHAALQWLKTARFQNSKLERWALRLQEFSFEVKHRAGKDNVVADCLSRSAMPLESSIQISNVWPEHYLSQKEIDDVPCTLCNDAAGWDNMVICEGCQRCFHLRCLIAPQTVAPSGNWYCPVCDPQFLNLDELKDENTPLTYHPKDPHLSPLLRDFLERGEDAFLTADVTAATKRSILHRAKHHKLYKVKGWFLVFKRLRAGIQRWLVCPPLEYRWDVIRVIHETLGHAGIEQTLTVLHQHFHWPGLKSDVADYRKACDSCQKQSLIQHSPPDLQKPVIRGPMKHVHIDLAGPFKTPTYSPYGQLQKDVPQFKSWVVLMIDYFTKTAEFAPVPGKEPHFIAKVFYDFWVSRYGVPDFLTSDNGTEFSNEFSHMLLRLGIKHIQTSAYPPASNGVVERLVQSFKSILSRHVNDHYSSWIQALPHIRSAYMNRIHSTLKVTPNEMLFGHPVKLPMAVDFTVSSLQDESSKETNDIHQASASRSEISHLYGQPELQIPDCQDPAAYLSEIREKISSLDSKAFELIHQQFQDNSQSIIRRKQERNSKPLHLKIGDLVLELDDSSGPLQAKARGPYRVIALKNQIVVLQTQSTNFKDIRQFERHITRLVKYYDKSSIRLQR